MKTAIVTGASSGIGREFAIALSKKGFHIIAVARRKDRLVEISQNLESCEIFPCDLTKREECFRLYHEVRSKNVSIVINCAGFGVFGKFETTDLDRELDLINLNITAVHILTKLFLKDFRAKNKGYILNVSSSAGLMPSGPYMSAYYASKAYVTSLTTAIATELSEENSNVYAGVLCPGPVDTEFNDVAGVKFGVKSISARECVDYALKKMAERKTVIVPTFTMKAAIIGQRFIPRKATSIIAGEIQKKKRL